ncbi:MAG: hypothetical protein JKY89_12815 [Immundisolibacteraceae bacterium]|nr:hypothetical protein [Immundisolibacteraceae bacterium]
MSLDIIGAGFGRTGTTSLKLALNELGLGPCYHMHDVFTNEGHAQLWRDAQTSGNADWDSLLAGQRAAVDWPPSFFWRQLVAAYPDAKVILTVRDPEIWYQSISTTIFPAQKRALPPQDAPVYPQMVMPREVIRYGTFDDRTDDKDYVIGVYQQHIADVQAGVPADKLLTYDLAEGWQHLCEFLEVPVPATPFPKLNTKKDFDQMISGSQDR